MSVMTAPAGWYRDPYRPSGSRHWDGTQWSDHVSAANGAVAPDPIGTAPQLPGPPVAAQAPLSAETVQAARRADLVRRWVIAITVIIIGGFGTYALMQMMSF